MSTLIPYNEPPIPRIALEIERLRQRLDEAEARLRDQAAMPPAPKLAASRFLAASSAIGALALVVIAGSLVWQQLHPVMPSAPTVVVQALPPAAQQAQASQPSQPPIQSQAQAGVQASIQAPAYRPPGLWPTPPRPTPRW
jgi:hypothetical protein